MKILLTNDDGYMAEGINCMYESLSKDFDITMVAPDRERSSCGHAISLTQPLRLNKIDTDKYSCSGFPADCVLISTGHIMRDEKPDVVISGPNHGANLGQDRFYSGTIAAAREAVFRGLKSISVSVTKIKPSEDFNFSLSTEYISKLLKTNILEIIPNGALLNINIPNICTSELQGVQIAKSGHQLYTEDVLERSDFKGNLYYWIGGTYDGHKDIDGSDCNIVHSKNISVEVQYVSQGADIVDEQLLIKAINCI